MSRLQAEGYRIPKDVAIASLYNSTNLDCYSPAVTAVSVAASQMGGTAVRQLIQRLRGKIMRRRRCWITTFYSENRQTNVAGEDRTMEFQKGMDLSFIPELEDAGVQVKDFDGTVMDPLDLVQKYGGKFRTAPYLECAGACQGSPADTAAMRIHWRWQNGSGTWHELYAGFPLF